MRHRNKFRRSKANFGILCHSRKVVKIKEVYCSLAVMPPALVAAPGILPLCQGLA
jgi:hypothetical protein